MTFTLDMAKAVKNIKGFNEQVVRGTFLDLSGKIIKDTPVGNPSLWMSKPPPGYVGGSLRGNWNASVGTPDRSRASAPDKAGNATISKANSAVSSFNSGQTLYLTNTLPYSERVEMGHSTQAPQGMVRINVLKFQAALNRAVKRGRI